MAAIMDLVEVKSANYIGEYSIRISFSDGNKKLVDFKPFLLKSLHPSISKYLNETLFKQFKITNGNLNWNDYDLIFPIHDLYEGTVS
jgi:hypothetical protein